ncbi:MAG TPA: GHKL domain-containing protein [Crenotrichaceae bacterium]|nr:GHKL domain-containing protein [Crenotrichaceae bacterium]
MTDSVTRLPKPLLRVYLLPFSILVLLYLLVIGCGSAWLYLTARQAQTELITGNIVSTVSPFIQQLNEHYFVSKESNSPFVLSQHAKHLYKILPHLRQVSIRDRNHGYGVRLTSQQQLVDVELEPLATHSVLANNHQQLARQLHEQSSPLFFVDFVSTADDGDSILTTIAFERDGLLNQISHTLQSVIHSIIVFSVIGLLSLLVALGIAVYTGLSTQQMEATLQRIYHQAAMGKLSASLVHDLRNPLASIRANIKNLLITPDETSQIVDELDHDLLRMENKLSDFLTLTKPRNSGFEKTNIEQIVSDLVKKCEPVFQQKNISLSTQIDANIPEITAISDDVSNAVFNLLMNAGNHTPQRGHIWIHAHYDQNSVTIIVEDDGAGIDDALITKIFEPFFTTREQGHGLGLAIVKRTVKAHHGTIKAEHRQPSGARFFMTLPIHHEK